MTTGESASAQAAQGYYFAPIETVRPSFTPMLTALRALFYKDYDRHLVPAVWMPHHGQLPPREPNNDDADIALDHMKTHGITAHFSHYESKSGARELVVMVNPYYANLLTDKELLTVVAHEYGHHFRWHLDRKKALEILPDYKQRIMPVQQSHECEADQFAAHYVDRILGESGAAAKLMESAARKKLARFLEEQEGVPPDDIQQAIQDVMREARDEHPSFENRLKMMAKEAITSLKPEQVRLDASCTLLQPVAPPKCSAISTASGVCH